MKTLRLALVVLAAFLPATIASAAGKKRFGKGERVECDGGVSYNILYPPAYETDKERKFPALFTSTPGDRASFYGMESWARRNNFLLIALNDTKNGQTGSQWTAAQKAVMAKAEQRERIHSCLRFSMGMSGGAMASMLLANNFGKKFAGICMLGHSGNGLHARLDKHMAVAFVHGRTDKIHPLSAVESVVRSLTAKGHAIKLHVGNWGHTTGPLDKRTAFMDWLYGRMRIVHPNLPLADRKAAVAELRARVKALADVADPAERLAKAEAIFGVPNVERMVDSKALHAAWYAAHHALAQAETDVAQRHELLSQLAEDPRVRKVATKARRELSAELRKMRSKSPVREEYTARRVYVQIKAAEKRAGKSRMRLSQVAFSYRSLAKRYPNTLAGRKAAEDVKRLAAPSGAKRR